jgi:hypothetical protein
LAVYGLGLDSPGTIATMYLSTSVPPLPCDKSWLADPSQPNATIFTALQQDSLQNLQTISTGTLPGSLIIVFAIDYVPRAAWSGWMFVAVAALLAVTGSTLFVAYETDKHAMTVVFYVLAQLLLNMGPNTMTWILPAELFATRYRATLYAVAAVAGKLGAITIQTIVQYKVHGNGKIPLAAMLLGLSPAMLAGALVTWAWVPEVQVPQDHDEDDDVSGSMSRSGAGTSNNSVRESAPDDDGSAHRASQDFGVANDAAVVHRSFLDRIILINRTLEDIADDPAENQTIGFRQKFSHLLPDRRRRGESTSENQDGHQLNGVQVSSGNAVSSGAL